MRCNKCRRTFSCSSKEYDYLGQYCRRCIPFPEPMCCNDSMVNINNEWLCVWCEYQIPFDAARQQFMRNYDTV